MAWSRRVIALGTLAVIQISCPLAVLAGAYPGTGAPLAAASRLTPEGDKTNPFAYPFLMEIAKSLAKNGLPPGFFLQGEGKSSSSIDLRAILLFEAGILKAPVRLLVPAKKEKVPSLSLSPVPESGQQFPGGEKPKTSSPQSPPAETSVKADLYKPRLSLDFDGLQPSTSDDKGNQVIAMAAPREARLPADNYTFRLWTLRTDGQPLAPLSKVQREPDNYQGSFIVTRQGAIGSIEGRSFFLKDGELLASSRGKALVFAAANGTITVPPGASIAVELTKGVASVNVLENTEGAVGVKLKNKGGSEEIRLSSGEQLVFSENPLTASDKSLLSTPASGAGSHGENWSKGKFSPVSFADKSVLFKGEPMVSGTEFRPAVKSLRSRLR